MIGWGTMFSSFPLFVAPMEAALGWSRGAINTGLTLSILVGGLLAIPAGRVVDRHGGRWPLTLGAWGAAVLLAAWSQVAEVAAYWAIFAGFGVVQAFGLWGPAMAVLVASARDSTRAIAGTTLITGFTVTIFVPLAAALIGGLGWRGALLVLAAMQVLPGVLTLWLPRAPPRMASAPGRRFALGPVVRGRAFIGLALCFAAHAFIGTALGAHAIPLLRERGLPEASVLLLVALHGPFQVAARAVLFAAGGRADLRTVGRVATLLLPAAMLALAFAPPALVPLLAYAAAWAVADGLLTIVRAAGVADILGREGYGAISGALAMAQVLPRTIAPLAVALLWEGSGGYGPVPLLLAGLGAVAAGAFLVAAHRR